MKRIAKIAYACILICIMNVSVTSFIYSIKHPDKTQMEVLMHVPYHYGWNFE